MNKETLNTKRVKEKRHDLNRGITHRAFCSSAELGSVSFFPHLMCCISSDQTRPAPPLISESCRRLLSSDQERADSLNDSLISQTPESLCTESDPSFPEDRGTTWWIGSTERPTSVLIVSLMNWVIFLMVSELFTVCFSRSCKSLWLDCSETPSRKPQERSRCPFVLGKDWSTAAFNSS